MKYIKLLPLLGLLVQTGCNRPEPDFTNAIVAVKDYVSGQPVAGAELFKIDRSDFDLSCLCFWTITENKIGSTNANGEFNGDITRPGNLEIRKTGYYEAGDINTAYIEETSGNKITYSVFKFAKIKIIKNPSGSYDDLLLKIGPVLKDGSFKSFFSDGFALSNLVSGPVEVKAIGDMQNRIVVIRGNNILLQKDVFVASNTITEVTLSY